MSNSIKAIDPVKLQIETFKSVIDEVNRIPGMQIDLKSENDSQRDSLAFLVNATYNQFKDNHWATILSDLPEKVKGWNTPPDAWKASSSLVSFIRNLYEGRVVELSSKPEVTGEEKERLLAILHLYSRSIDSVLQNPVLGQPVNISGISYSLLPEWYVNRQYLA